MTSSPRGAYGGTPTSGEEKGPLRGAPWLFSRRRVEGDTRGASGEDDPRGVVLPTFFVLQ